MLTVILQHNSSYLITAFKSFNTSQHTEARRECMHVRQFKIWGVTQLRGVPGK